MNYRVGSNQYQKKHVEHWKETAFIGLVFLDLILGFRWGYLVIRNHGMDLAQAETVISPVAGAITPTPTQTPEQVATQEEIEKYIRTIFGKDARVAIAVSHNECGPTNRMYPKCNLHTNVENSVGLFQINIESETTKIHWARIPGTTLDAKKTWLEEPHNNTLMAYWIFTKSGWGPWSAYSSGRYLKDM